MIRCSDSYSMDGNVFLLVLCLKLCLSFGHHHGLILVMQPESWEAAQLYCQRHFVDLAAAHTELQLGPMFDLAEKAADSVWIGLSNIAPNGWSWVDGQALSYNPWKKESRWGTCGTIDSRLPGNKKLLQRICMEPRPFICQGPVPPDAIEVDFVETDCVFLKWDRPVAMETVQYSFNITYSSQSQGNVTSELSNSTSISVCGLSPGSKYTFSVSTVMQTAAQSIPTSISVTTRPVAPPKVWVESIRSNSVSLSWTAVLPESSASYLHISYSSFDGSQSGFTMSPMNYNHLFVTDLQSQTSYIFNLTAVSISGSHSIPIIMYIHTCCPDCTIFSTVLWSLECITAFLTVCLLYCFINKRIGKKNAVDQTDSMETTQELILESLEV